MTFEALDRINAKIEAKRQAQREADAKAWKTIQTEAPDVAELLTEFSRVFGKPAALRVEIDGEEVLSKGKFC